jgi:UDP-N-acetylmuramate--alanine ligase
MHYHIVGIAGAGMSAMANVLLDQGHTVSGSDLHANPQTAALAARGAALFRGHDAANIGAADALLATSAVRADHPELAAAQARGIPLQRRTDLWREWSQQRCIIAVAGSHGKTTTTAMLALALTQAGVSPGFVVGSMPLDLPINACWGDPAAPLVIEADEYDHAFLALRPAIAIITTIDWDHPDIYPDDATYRAAFAQFAAQVQPGGTLLLCGDAEAGVRPAALPTVAQVQSYGLEPHNAYRAIPAAPGGALRGDGDSFTVVPGQGAPGPACQLRVPGLHNIRNALAAAAVGDLLGLERSAVLGALGSFRGTARRLEHKGEAGGVTVFDDYAHHPTEVRATLAAARARYVGRRLVVYVQPHTYSRTVALLDQWPGAFAEADMVLVGDIYAAREQPPAGLTPADLLAQLVERIAAVHADVTAVGPPDAAVAQVAARLLPGDVLITCGAGDGYLIGEAIAQQRAASLAGDRTAVRNEHS